MSGHWEAVATCTGEQTDRGPTRLRQQTEKGAPGAHVGQLAVGGPPARGSRRTHGWHPRDRRLRMRAPGACAGRLVGHLHWGAGGLRTHTLETAD